MIYDIQTGNLINKLQKQGPGPEEYGDISFFDVDESNDVIVIYDVRQGNIYQYDLNGQFLKSIFCTNNL